MATSIGSSPVTFSATLATVPYSMTSFSPEDVSKKPANSCTAARIAPPLSTFNSAALTGQAEQAASAAMIATIQTALVSGVFDEIAEGQRAAEALQRPEAGDSRERSLSIQKRRETLAATLRPKAAAELPGMKTLFWLRRPSMAHPIAVACALASRRQGNTWPVTAKGWLPMTWAYYLPGSSEVNCRFDPVGGPHSHLPRHRPVLHKHPHHPDLHHHHQHGHA